MGLFGRLAPRREHDTRRVADVNSHIIPSIDGGKPNAKQAAQRTMATQYLKSETWNNNSASRVPSPAALKPQATSDVRSASNTLSKGY